MDFTEETRRCRRCSEFYPFDHFNKRSDNGQGGTLCRACRAKENRRYYESRQTRSAKFALRWRRFDPNDLIALDCLDCGLMKEPSDFHKRTNGRIHDRYCWKCKYARMRSRWVEDPEALLHRRIVSRLRHYGLTKDEYQALRDLQGGACALCLEPFTTTRKEHIDHDHKTGIVRGLLCPRCNHGVGFIGQSIESLLRAINYLQDPPSLKILEIEKS